MEEEDKGRWRMRMEYEDKDGGVKLEDEDGG